MAKSTGGTPGGTWKPTWDDKKTPPLKSPKGKPQDPPIKKAKKNKNKKGDPEGEYSRPLPGAPSGHNIAINHGNPGHSTPGNSVNDNEHNYG